MASNEELKNLAKLQVSAEVDFGEEDVVLAHSLENELEYVRRRLTTNVDVPGNIHKEQYRQFWREEIEAPEFILKTLEEGYELPFSSIPPPSFKQNNASARQDMGFVRAEVARLEALGCIKRVAHRPHCVFPLSSVFSKKTRLVVDGSRCLNPFLLHRRVKLQDLREVPEVVKPGCFMATNDLDNGYWHLAVKPEH